MSPTILYGRPAAEKILASLKADLRTLPAGVRAPGLAVIQVGDVPASNTYIRHKEKAAESCGIQFFHERLDENISSENLKKEIARISNQSHVDGVIVQLPFGSAHLNSPQDVRNILAAIPPEKDADGLSVVNQGKLFTGESKPHRWTAPLPATPLGIYRLIENYGYTVKGRNVAVIGKSRLVGFPTAGLLSQVGATVALCHRRTQDITPYTKLADLIVVAAGSKHLLKPEHIKPGVILIDVGIHVQDDGKLTGDVHPDCYALASAYSPVPGGVGPMTVASLMENTFRLHARNFAVSGDTN